MKNVFADRFIPRWTILLFDICIVLFSVYISFQVRFNFKVPAYEIHFMEISFLVILATRLLLFILFGTFKNIIRYTSTTDAIRISANIILGSILFVAANVVSYYGFGQPNLVPYSIIIIELMMTAGLILGYRVMLKVAFLEMRAPSKEKTWVVIFGAGESGIITKRAIDRDAGSKYKVLAFFDDDQKKIGKKIEGIQIHSADKLEELLSLNQVAHVVLSIQNLSPQRKTEITDLCLKYKTKVLVVPPVRRWINGELSFKQIRKINIEELLERDVIQISNEKVGQEIAGQVVLITGAAGSIGSELVRQICEFHPAKLICVDQAETPMFHLQNELEQRRVKDYKIIIADICDELKMKQIFSEFRPALVFHAAAYKHVPMMELNPSEAVRNNVLGTRLLADMAMEFHAKKFVFISTDKAVNPTNVMGASKRIAEMYVQSHDKKAETRFITTRFGNVLGSNGSVIPLFRKQIESGGPVTVTDANVTRFFMTIPEAVSLVLEAGTMGQGGEIFIFDMGKSVKILDLAQKMILLSGLTLGKDIQIEFTGLRPGEKLYEELLADKENTLPTYHERILIARVESRDAAAIDSDIKLLSGLVNEDNYTEIVRKMKTVVPEFQSRNSIFEQLDKK
ncbi:MAG TPA: polysaccharide biosynthesis protein [Bacteroidales bacterium]|nr:polysaccharide biosynthesis protein [Bacteroidales bacterium]HCB61323.1 polysaccharide biosynthesis protein [Bacteroidales bacterium]HCY24198.1 polysaccharide biosynthesis protein [Bacteroidales bacterium]